MGAEIERIVDRKTIRGRVHYLVVWRGFGEESNTWESRMDLVADGFSNVIREFENGRKGQEGEDGARGRSKSPGRPRGRSRSNSTPRSPSVGRGRGRKAQQEVDANGEVIPKPARKRAPKKSEDKDKAKDKDDLLQTTSDGKADAKAVTKTKKTVVTSSSTTAGAKATARRTTRKEEKQHVEVAYEENGKAVKTSKTVVEKSKHTEEQLELEPVKEPSEGDADGEKASKWQTLVQSGGLLWIVSALVVVLSLVASYYLPVLGYDRADSKWRQWIPFLTPVIALLLVFRQKDSRASIKWVAIGLAWRAAAELLYLVGTSFEAYWKIALGCFAVANLSFMIAVVTIIREHEHARSTATFAVFVLGVFAVFLSDSWILQGTLPGAYTRTTLMAVAVLTISLSPMLTTVPEEDN